MEVVSPCGKGDVQNVYIFIFIPFIKKYYLCACKFLHGFVLTIILLDSILVRMWSDGGSLLTIDHNFHQKKT